MSKITKFAFNLIAKGVGLVTENLANCPRSSLLPSVPCSEERTFSELLENLSTLKTLLRKDYFEKTSLKARLN